MQIHDPSPGCADRRSSTLKSDGTVMASGGVAAAFKRTSPQGAVPCEPMTVALSQWAELKPRVSQPFSRFVEASHDESETTFVWPLRLKWMSSPAGPDLFSARTAMTFSPWFRRTDTSLRTGFL